MKTTKLTYLFIMFFFLLSACSKEDKLSMQKSLSGEDIFKGIIFGEGNVADLIPQIKSNKIQPKDIFSSQEEVDVVLELRKKIITTIGKNSPGFFNDFKTRLTSKDPIEIESGLKEASRNIYLALAEINHLNTDKEKEAFSTAVAKSRKELIVHNSDGNIDKEKTTLKIKKALKAEQATSELATSSLSLKKTSFNSGLIDSNKVDNNQVKNPAELNTAVCALVVGVVVAVVVIAVVAVEAAVVTDTWFWVTSGIVAGKDSEGVLYKEELIASIAEAI